MLLALLTVAWLGTSSTYDVRLPNVFSLCRVAALHDGLHLVGRRMWHARQPIITPKLLIGTDKCCLSKRGFYFQLKSCKL